MRSALEHGKVVDVENGEPRLVELCAELTGALLTEMGPMEVLALLTSRCPAMLHVDSAVGVVIDGSQFIVTGSHEVARSLMLYEMQCGNGPSWECFSSGQPFINVDLTSAMDRWPSYAARALSVGITTGTALPLRARTELVGALYFCGTFECWAVRLGQALADTCAAVVVTQRALASSARTASQLQAALTSRVVIEQAKGMISEHHQVSVEDAFKLLRSHARHTRRSIHEVAQEVTESRVIPSLLPRRKSAPDRKR